jgi:hypothetical protein
MPWKVWVLFDGMERPVSVGVDDISFVSADYAAAKAGEADHA